MGGDERDSMYRWFLPQLAQAWDSVSSGVAQVDEERYVQWAGYRLGLQIECVSNQNLSGDARLSAAQVERLRRLGWHDPLGKDLPNHWRSFFDRDDLTTAAGALVDAVHVIRGRVPGVGPAVPRSPGRTVVVVPVMKVDHRPLLNSLAAALDVLSDAVIIDLFDLPELALPLSENLEPLPTASVEAVLEVGGLLQYPLVADSGLRFPGGPIAESRRSADSLLQQLARLRAAGRNVLVLGPRLLPVQEQLYASVLKAVSDAVVFCVPAREGERLTAELIGGMLPALGRVPRFVVAAAQRVSDELLPVLAGVDGVVATRSQRLQVETLAALFGAAWPAVADTRSRRLRDALTRARMLPLRGRLLASPGILDNEQDVAAAVSLLFDTLTVLRKGSEPVQAAGLPAGWVLPDLCGRLADAAPRKVPGIGRARGPLRVLTAPARPNAKPPP